jgi:hypothetical protein
MAKRTGIEQNTVQKIVSGARVAFDPRTTAEVITSIDMTNRKPRKSQS